MIRNKALKRINVLVYLEGVGNCFIAINETSIYFIRQCRTKDHYALVFKNTIRMSQVDVSESGELSMSKITEKFASAVYGHFTSSFTI